MTIEVDQWYRGRFADDLHWLLVTRIGEDITHSQVDFVAIRRKWPKRIARIFGTSWSDSARAFAVRCAWRKPPKVTKLETR